MEAKQFTEQVEVRTCIKELTEAVQGKPFSDVIDDQNNQYVDIVMEGNGVLGIALVGFTYCLEQVGIRFMGIGGTSAGAINALFLAALDERQNKKSEKIIDLVANLNLSSFVDGDQDAEDFIKTFMAGAGWIKLSFKALQIIDNLREHLGLNPGKQFQEWVEKSLKNVNITSTKELEVRMNIQPTGLRHRMGDVLEPTQVKALLALIAAEVRTETKVEFPKMAPLFWNNPDEVNPSWYVRGSMSIPYFFHPFIVRNLPDGNLARSRWETLAGYRGELPKTCLFIDGAIMSNFPIDVFHETEQVPQAPTFGVKLGFDRQEPSTIDGPISLGNAIFDCARHTLDYDFLLRNPDYKHLVSTIDTGRHNWLDFDLTENAKIDLFKRGVKCAAKFLTTFKWEKYKEIRSSMAKAHKASDY